MRTQLAVLVCRVPQKIQRNIAKSPEALLGIGANWSQLQDSLSAAVWIKDQWHGGRLRGARLVKARGSLVIAGTIGLLLVREKLVWHHRSGTPRPACSGIEHAAHL